MATDLDTIPREVEVTTDSVGVWAVSFAAAMEATDASSIDSCAAELYPVPPAAAAPISGFVTAATVDGMAVNVSWTGSVLQRYSEYRLETRATLDTGAVVEFLTAVRCVA